jgi:Pyruvate/2-oxoacid:ferredoxin oxidoreductase gamma subunit
MVMLGAASGYLMVKEESLKKFLQVLFARHGESVVASNLKAFDLGRAAAGSLPPDEVKRSGG